jgi:hypothetical protein
MAQSIHVKLAAHHDNLPRFHERIETTLTHGRDGSLQLVYVVHGLNLDLRVPTPHAPAPDNALWKTTCCELFLNPAGQPGYREFNFSPSGQWAAYEFSDTRQLAQKPCDCPTPRIDCERSEDLLKLTVTLPKHALPNWKNEADTLRIAVSAILEAEGGHHAYWALAHPPGKPDFHHHAGFVLSLGSTGFRPTHWP